MSPTSPSTPRNTSLAKLVDQGSSRSDIADYMSGLSPRKRVDEALSITGKRQAKLFEAVEGGRKLTPADFVPDDVSMGRTIIFEGRNSLPMFTRFQKRFARVESGQVVGYNHQTWAFATGPGFFVVKEGVPEAKVLGELYLDYTDMPKEVPLGWP